MFTNRTVGNEQTNDKMWNYDRNTRLNRDDEDGGRRTEDVIGLKRPRERRSVRPSVMVEVPATSGSDANAD